MTPFARGPRAAPFSSETDLSQASSSSSSCCAYFESAQEERPPFWHRAGIVLAVGGLHLLGLLLAFGELRQATPREFSPVPSVRVLQLAPREPPIEEARTPTVPSRPARVRPAAVPPAPRKAAVPVPLSSSAANIPVNLELCRRLELHEDTYSISIPLGATINMAGAAITIAVMSLAAAHTVGIAVDLPTALLLSVVSALGACGASGVAGGSLLLIPMACNLFGIPTDVAMQVVAIGFIIGVVQDSVETALNSSTDVLFTAAACRAAAPSAA